MNTTSMERNQYFSPRRFYLLLKRDFLTYYRTIIIAASVIGGFVIFASTISAITQNSRNFHPVLYFLLLYIGGFIVSSRAFREIHNSQKSYTYVTLPGSLLEKFSERLISTSIGYVLGTLLVYSIFTVISEGLNQAFFRYTHTFLNPLSRNFWIGSAAYLVIQGVFLAGSLFFKKNSLIKTILMLIVFGIALLIIVIITVRLIIPGYFEGVHPAQREFQSLRELAEWLGMTETGLKSAGRTIWLIIRLLFWAVLAPLCWIVSYLKFRKIEV